MHLVGRDGRRRSSLGVVWSSARSVAGRLPELILGCSRCCDGQRQRERRSLRDSTYAHASCSTAAGRPSTRPIGLRLRGLARPIARHPPAASAFDEPAASAAADLATLAAGRSALLPRSTRAPCPSDARRVRPCWRSPAASRGTSTRSRGVPCVLHSSIMPSFSSEVKRVHCGRRATTCPRHRVATPGSRRILDGRRLRFVRRGFGRPSGRSAGIFRGRRRMLAGHTMRSTVRAVHHNMPDPRESAVFYRRATQSNAVPWISAMRL